MRGQPIISQMLICFSTLYYDIISLKITQAYHLLFGFAENPIASWYFKIWNSIRITEIRIIEVLLYIYWQLYYGNPIVIVTTQEVEVHFTQVIYSCPHVRITMQLCTSYITVAHQLITYVWHSTKRLESKSEC